MDLAKEPTASVKVHACFQGAVPEVLVANYWEMQDLEEEYPHIEDFSVEAGSVMGVKAGHMVPAESTRTIAVSLVNRACQSCLVHSL